MKRLLTLMVLGLFSAGVMTGCNTVLALARTCRARVGRSRKRPKNAAMVSADPSPPELFDLRQRAALSMRSLL